MPIRALTEEEAAIQRRLWEAFPELVPINAPPTPGEELVQKTLQKLIGGKAIALLEKWSQHILFVEADGWETCRGCGTMLDDGEVAPIGHHPSCLIVETRVFLYEEKE